MNRIIAFFNFNFLKKIDRYLLLNHSKIWVFKLPYVLFYGFILNFLLMLILLFIEKKIYDIPEFSNTILIYYFLGIFFILKKMSIYTKVGKEYGRDLLSGLEEFLLLLLTFFILGTSLFTIQNMVFLKKYPYEFGEHERSFIYVDDNNTSKALAMYKNEYSQIILDLTSVSKKEEITNDSITTAKENYEFYYDLNSYEWVGLELFVLLVFTLFIFYYRMIGGKKLFFIILVIFPFLTVEDDIRRVFAVMIIQYTSIGLVYFFSKNKLLPFAMFTFVIWVSIVSLCDAFLVNMKFPFNLITIFVAFIVTILFISPVKRKLLELEAEPKEL